MNRVAGKMQMLFKTAAECENVKKMGAVDGGNQTLDRLAEQLAKMSTEQEFVITRVFDAPRERVWKAWTEAERLKHWWGPKGFTVHTCKVDLRPGGVFHYGMRAE